LFGSNSSLLGNGGPSIFGTSSSPAQGFPGFKASGPNQPTGGSLLSLSQQNNNEDGGEDEGDSAEL